MKTLEEMLKEINNSAEEDDVRHRMESCKAILEENIAGDRVNYLVYKEVIERKTDISFASFWMSTAALLIALLACSISIFQSSTERNLLSEGYIYWILALIVFFLVMVNAYYVSVYKNRKKNYIFKIALEEIKDYFQSINKRNKKWI